MFPSNKAYLLTLFACVFEVICLDFKYHSNHEITDYLKNFTELYPELNPMLYSIGESTQGSIHGNEPVGREMLLHFLELLTTDTDSRVSWLLNNTRIHIMPTLNPDGYIRSTEGMCGGVDGRNTFDNKDLSRCFSDYFRMNKIPQPKEAIAVIKWMKDIPFILSASLHSGSVIASYPFDSLPDNGRMIEEIPPQLSISPDDDVFVHLASTYANAHTIMHKGNNCGNGPFEGGITNGAARYPFLGGIQDYNYVQGCMEVTLAISCCKFPPRNTLEEKWHENKEALLHYCMQANRGVTGLILDSITKSHIPEAKLKIRGRNMYFKSSKRGEFWRILLPGNYTLEVQASGYHPLEIFFNVELAEYTQPVFLNVELVNATSPLPTTTGVQTTSLQFTTSEQGWDLLQPTPEINRLITGSDSLTFSPTSSGKCSSCSLFMTFLIFSSYLINNK